MDIVQAFRNLFKYWNYTSHCGECWEFEAPLTEALANTSLAKTEGCCYRVFLVNYSKRENRTYNASGLVADRYDEHSFDLLVLKQSDFGRNQDIEQVSQAPAGDLIQYTDEESKWRLYHKPVLDCFEDSILETLCGILGRSLRNTGRSWSPVINYMDQNYDGWRIRMNLQDYRPDKSDDLYEYVGFSLQWWDGSEEMVPGSLTVILTGAESGNIHSLTWDGETVLFLNNGMDTEFEVQLANSGGDPQYLVENTIQLETFGDIEVATALLVRNAVILNGPIPWEGSLGSDEDFDFTLTGTESMTEYAVAMQQQIVPISEAFTPALESADINFQDVLSQESGYTILETTPALIVNGNLVLNAEAAAAPMFEIVCWDELAGTDTVTLNATIAPGTACLAIAAVVTDENDPINSIVQQWDVEAFLWVGNGQVININVPSFAGGLGQYNGIMIYDQADTSYLLWTRRDDLTTC